MLKLLVKKQIYEIFRSYFYDAKKNCARSKAAIIGYVILFVFIMCGILGGMFTAISLVLCGPFAAVGMDWLYFVIMGLMAILLGTFGSVFNTYSCLYLPKDNDLLLSLPIPVDALIASRLIAVYLMGAMYSVVVIFPAVAVYWVNGVCSAKTVLGSLVLILLITVFVLILSCVLGLIVAKISLKLKNKSIVTVLVSIAFIGGYYFFYFKAQVLIMELLENAAVYGAKIKGAVYPLYLFGQIGMGNGKAMLVVSAAALFIFAMIWRLISRSFLSIATATEPIASRVYRETDIRQRSVFSALLHKEFARFLSSSLYMLNCGLGILILPVSGLALLWKRNTVVLMMQEIFGEYPGSIPVLFCTFICILVSMNNMAVPSISLEGKNLWIVQSLPVAPKQILLAKLTMQILLTAVPACFCLVCICLSYPFSVMEILISFVLIIGYVIVLALLDLYIGVITANTEWVTEITPIKQNIGVLFAILCGFILSAGFCAGFILLNGWKLGFAGYTMAAGIVLVVLGAVIWRLLGCQGDGSD